MNSDLFWQLIEKEHDKARAFCGRLTGDFNDGDDLYQESVIRAFGGFVGLRQVDSFRPWFYRVINNTYKCRFRNPWWKRIRLQATELESDTWNTNPADLYEAKRRLSYAFAALSADDRIIVTLAELEGWKISELAELTSKTEGFIKMRLSRARRKMRERLGRLHRKTVKYACNKGTEKICCVTKPEKD